jgi:hypothetical protein
MPASAIAARTASAVASICARRPSSSGQEVARVRAADHQARPAWPASARRRVNTVKCGDSTPSVPPDITSATRAAASAT